MPVHDGRAPGKRGGKTLGPSGSRPGIVHHPDPGPAGLDDPPLRQQPPNLDVVHVSVHALESPQRLELAQERQGREVAAVEDQLGRPELGDTALRQAPRTPRQMGVGEDSDERQSAIPGRNAPSR